MVGMALAGLAGVAAIYAVGPFGTETPTQSASLEQVSATTSAGNAGAPSHPIAALGDSSAVSWLAKLFDVPKPPQAETAAPDMPDSGVPDPRAATRVQSFSCDGSLSASRSLVCTRWDLATADYNLSLSYKTALMHARNPRALRRARAAWLQQLDALRGDAKQILRHIEAFQRTIAAA
jgi:hypothetical protein